MILDITRTLGADTLTWPGDTPFAAHWEQRIENGDAANLRALKLSNHSGTHLDAPAHMLADGITLDRMPVERFRMPAHVIEIPRGIQCIEPEHFDAELIQPGEAALFKTDNTQMPRDSFGENFVYVSENTANSLARRRVGLAGIDYLSIDAFDDEEAVAHKILLNAESLILEDVDLRSATAGRYILWCLPLKFTGADGAPCRAVLETI